MCLVNNPAEVKKLFESKIKKFVCCKVLTKGLHAPVYSHWYRIGENKSNTRAKVSNIKKEIQWGIHTRRNFRAAEAYLNEYAYISEKTIVRFTALKEDLIGANKDQMVFKKVYLSKKEYKKHKYTTTIK